jgi:hypothetical protein
MPSSILTRPSPTICRKVAYRHRATLEYTSDRVGHDDLGPVDHPIVLQDGKASNHFVNAGAMLCIYCFELDGWTDGPPTSVGM